MKNHASKRADIDPAFMSALDDRYGSGKRMSRYLERLIPTDIQLAGTKILDIGGGDGVIAHYLAHFGATVQVVDSYSDGEIGGSFEFFQRLQAELSLPGEVSLIQNTFQNFMASTRFDIVVSHNSINHLDEIAVRDLHKNPQSKNIYTKILSAVADHLEPGGLLIVSDCARRNLFGDLRIRNPFAPNIDFHLHQGPKTWKPLLNSSGFERVGWTWNSMLRTGSLGELLLSNQLGAYLTTSHFTLRAIRKL